MLKINNLRFALKFEVTFKIIINSLLDFFKIKGLRFMSKVFKS